MDAPEPVAIPDHVLEAVGAEAIAAGSDECCGWLAGPDGADVVTVIRPCHNAQAGAPHPIAPDRDAETAYVIAGSDLLAFSRAFDSDQPPKVIYHSHPNGRASFSATDRAIATDPWGTGPMYPVQQLVVGIGGEVVREAALFAWSGDGTSGDFVEVRRWSFQS